MHLVYVVLLFLFVVAVVLLFFCCCFCNILSLFKFCLWCKMIILHCMREKRIKNALIIQTSRHTTNVKCLFMFTIFEKALNCNIENKIL